MSDTRLCVATNNWNRLTWLNLKCVYWPDADLTLNYLHTRVYRIHHVSLILCIAQYIGVLVTQNERQMAIHGISSLLLRWNYEYNTDSFHGRKHNARPVSSFCNFFHTSQLNEFLFAFYFQNWPRNFHTQNGLFFFASLQVGQRLLLCLKLSQILSSFNFIPNHGPWKWNYNKRFKWQW